MQTDSREVLDASGLRSALARCCDAVEGAAPELNALDARLGDGDLGTTLSKCAGNLRALLAAPPGTLEALLKGCGQACAKASGSSFGTLLGVAFLSAAKTVGQREALDRDMLVALLADVGEALSQRGGAVTGDKTMLDSRAAIVGALRDAPDATPAVLKDAARRGAQQALDAFRGHPNRIGRARMFAERSIGLDDPGMVAVQRMVQAL
jgi:dihydroxyacetone kinase-like protein